MIRVLLIHVLTSKFTGIRKHTPVGLKSIGLDWYSVSEQWTELNNWCDSDCNWGFY